MQHQIVKERFPRPVKADLQRIEKDEKTEMQIYYHEQFERHIRIEKHARYQEEMLAAQNFKVRRAMLKWLEKYGLKPIEKVFEEKCRAEAEKNFKLSVESKHLGVFATMSGNQLYFYILSNRKLVSNVQSTIEIEVLKWSSSDNAIVGHHPRQYLPFFVQPPEESKENDKGFIDEMGDRVFYKFAGQDESEKDIEEQKLEMWYKIASSFRQSSEVNSSRLIFTAGSRSSWVFDLQMHNGGIRLYSKADVEAGRAIGLKKRPFCRAIDFIDDNFINMLTLTEEAKWKKPNVIESKTG